MIFFSVSVPGHEWPVRVSTKRFHLPYTYGPCWPGTDTQSSHLSLQNMIDQQEQPAFKRQIILAWISDFPRTPLKKPRKARGRDMPPRRSERLSSRGQSHHTKTFIKEWTASSKERTKLWTSIENIECSRRE
jgi:hypothetical protein